MRAMAFKTQTGEAPSDLNALTGIIWIGYMSYTMYGECLRET